MAHSAETTNTNQFAEQAQSIREQLAPDPQRPGYHFLPPANWLNDPNGLIQWNGQYHLFYQYNPASPFWGTIHWGHTTSTDLVHWTDLPIALAPTPGGPDEDGCWSGCAVDNHGIPTLIYSGNRGDQQRPCVATSADDLLTWEKYAGNPVIPAPPQDLDVVAFRDHCVWQDGDIWYQIIGSGIKDVGGTVLLYTSQDLLHWEYIHPICVGDATQTEPLWTGSMWECPDLFALEDKHVLMVSVWDNNLTYYPIYFIGTYADHIFTPEYLQKLDFGTSFYAPQSMRDAQGRRLVWGWLREARDLEAQGAAGWSGVMSLPWMLSIRSDGILGIQPVPELEALRGQHYQFRDIDLTPTSSDLLEDVQGDMLEILAEIDPGDAMEVGIAVRCSPDEVEQTRLLYQRVGQRLVIDRSRSSLSSSAYRDVQEGPFELSSDEPLRLHVFLDRSVLEVFANERASIACRIYPSRADSLGIDLFASGGNAKLISMDIWEMASIWGQGKEHTDSTDGLD